MKSLSWAPLGAFALAMATLAPVAHAQQKSVAVTAIVEHPALDSVRDGVQAALKAAGYESGKNVQVLAGLTVGTEVIVAGQNGLSEGTPVEPLRLAGAETVAVTR